jgi:hypothetical protein
VNRLPNQKASGGTRSRKFMQQLMKQTLDRERKNCFCGLISQSNCKFPGFSTLDNEKPRWNPTTNAEKVINQNFIFLVYFPQFPPINAMRNFPLKTEEKC